MKIEIQGTPTFYFRLSLVEVKVLMELAHRHYDFACKRSAQPGGPIHQWRSEIELAAEIRGRQNADERPYDPPLRASHDDLDLVAKVCEPMSMVGIKDEWREVAAKVYMAFMFAMTCGNEKYREWRIEVDNNPEAA